MTEPITSRKVVLSANSDWNIANFRQGLVRAVSGAGFQPVVIAPQDPEADARMRDLGIERIPIRIDRSGLNPLADLALLAQYRRHLSRLRPAAYLGFTIKPNVYGSLAAASLGIPSLPNVSGLGTAFIRDGMLQRLVTGLYRLAFARAPVVFFQNADDRNLFLHRRIVRPGQARLLPGSGVDVEQFSPSALPKGPPTFLFIGRLLRDKGVVEFAEAAKIVRREIPNARFQLLGGLDPGNRSAIASRELGEWVAKGQVEHLGTTDDVRPFIAAASAVVLPSYREGLPRSLLEAAAMGRPLIASDVPGCRDVIDDGVNGLLCKVRSAGSLSAAMRKFAQLPRAAQVAMGEAGRRKVQAGFSEALVVRAYLDALTDLGAAKPRS